MACRAIDMINVMVSWVGKKESDGSHKSIIDLYNSHKPLARGYKVKYTDSWCDATVSAAAIKCNAVDIIGTECGCEQHVKIFKKKGIWIEDGTITPRQGDIILYNWDKATQPNDGYSDHIGLVTYVSGSTITCIEGNKSNAVGYRTLQVGNGNIRGYARPRYISGPVISVPEVKPPAATGSGNVLTAKSKTKFLVSGTGTPNKTCKFMGTCTADVLNVRTWAGTNNPTLKSVPSIKYGKSVEVMDAILSNDGGTWYYIRINGKTYGFVSARYIA